ncbi:MAG TPA: VWA domain-containing protein [Vicinamibacterales bacterium]|nr:VWA domain-containing protein [Vicinamibacterales bacterium]
MSAFSRVVSGMTVLAAVVAAPGLAAAQAERSVYASVLDKGGAPVTALTARDFIVREDGVEREVLRAARADEPLQIAVLVDTSQAVERHIPDLRRALTTFFREMAGEHELALIGFGERPAVLVQYTRDLARLEAGVGLLFARRGSGAYALDAIVDASRALGGREGARHAIVVITTEGPEFSERYHQQVLDELGSRAMLHSFILSRRGGFLDEGRRQREITLEEGASATGGRREHLLTSMALEDRLHGLAVELKNQYRVDYARPAALIPPEKIDVDVRRPGVTVRAPRAVPAVRTGS